MQDFVAFFEKLMMDIFMGECEFWHKALFVNYIK